MVNKKVMGKLMGFDIAASGETNGRSWTIYKYRIQTDEGELELADFKDNKLSVGVEREWHYTEEPNPKNPKYMRRNLVMDPLPEEEPTIEDEEETQEEIIPLDELEKPSLTDSEKNILEKLKLKADVLKDPNVFSDGSVLATFKSNLGCSDERAKVLLEEFKK